MKIAMVSNYPWKGERHGHQGGVASYTRNLVTNMTSQINKKVKIYVLCEKQNKFDSYQEDGAEIIRCFDKSPKFIFQINKQLKSINPDVIHIQQEMALYGNVVTALLLQLLLFALRFKRKKVIITLHGVVNLELVDKEFVERNNSNLPTWAVKSALYLIFKPLTIWANKVIVHEQYFKDILVSQYGVNENRILVIHHGIEDLKPIPKNIARQKLKIGAKQDVVLFMGYMTGYKGIDLLIKGFAKYAKTNSNALLLIGAGEHPKLKDEAEYKEKYKAMQTLASTKIPNNNYRWVGFIKEEDIVTYYSASDVSVYPYTIQMSSSGPMAISIGLGVPFLASNKFESLDFIKKFNLSHESICDSLQNFFTISNTYKNSIKKIKSERIWSQVAKETLNIY